MARATALIVYSGDVVLSATKKYKQKLQPKGTEDYLPAGVMAVPRSQQVSQAVFEQEENLKTVS